MRKACRIVFLLTSQQSPFPDQAKQYRGDQKCSRWLGVVRNGGCMPLCGAPSGSHLDALHTIVTLSEDFSDATGGFGCGAHRRASSQGADTFEPTRSATTLFLQGPVLLDEEGRWETTLSIKGVRMLRSTGLSSVQDATLNSARTCCAPEDVHSRAFAH